MQIRAENHPDDEIRIGLLCPAQGWKGLCHSPALLCAQGSCGLNGKAVAVFCKIPVSHPVSQLQRAQFVRDPALPLN